MIIHVSSLNGPFGLENADCTVGIWADFNIQLVEHHEQHRLIEDVRR